MGHEVLEEAGPLDATEYLAAVVLGLAGLLLDDTGLPAFTLLRFCSDIRLAHVCSTFEYVALHLTTDNFTNINIYGLSTTTA